MPVYKDKRRNSDTSLKNMYVLLGGFQDTKEIIPVKMEVKELSDAPNKLYMFVSLYPIEKVAVDHTQLDHKGSSYALATLRNSTSTIDTISISQFVKNINPLDKDFLKYCPDKMLSKEQRLSKYKAIEVEKLVEKNKQSISKGSGADVSKIRRGKNATPKTGNVTTSPVPSQQKTQKKNTSKKGGFWGL